MKLYDVIRKENQTKGKPLPEIPKLDREGNHVPHGVVKHPRPSRIRHIITVGVAVLFVVLLYIIGMKVVHAKVVIVERRVPFTLNNVEFELVHEEDATGGRLAFQTMVVPTEVSRQVYGSQVDQSNTLARGKIVIFNEYSTKAQTIKSGTTITGTNGKTYKTQAAATVPGYTTKDKKKVAGTSPAIPILATAAGDAYNTSGTTFTIAGWTGSKAKQLYAQSSGSISGGGEGATHSVSDADKSDVVATLQSQLIERLKRETRAQIPDTLIAFPDLQVTTIDSESLQLKGTSFKFPASIKGTMVTYLISRDLLESAIAHEALSEHTYANVTIPSLGDLVVEPVTALPTDPKNIPETIKVRISGQGTIITKAPVEQIKESIVGRPKHDFARILAEVPEVDTAQYHFYPFWAPFFPNLDSRITIEVK